LRIREATPEDTQAVIALFEQLYSETTFLLYQSGEAVPRVDDYARRIGEDAKAENGVMFVADNSNGLLGVIFGNRGTANRIRHSLFLVMGVLEAHWSRGIGSGNRGVGNDTKAPSARINRPNVKSSRDRAL
jgi:hypothetical protein